MFHRYAFGLFFTSFTILSSTPGKCHYHCPIGRYARALADFGMCCRLDEHTARHFGHRGLCFRRLGRVEALVGNLVLKNLGQLYLPFSTCPFLTLVRKHCETMMKHCVPVLAAKSTSCDFPYHIMFAVCLAPLQFNPPLLLY